MATYEEWNERLFDYVILGVPRGARIYLAIDDEVIEFIANQLGTTPSDFFDSIRLKCVKYNNIVLNKIYSPYISQEQYKSKPRYLAFLCAMVLAAHRMGENIEEGVSEINYFYYFNKLFKLTTESGRPLGMEHGAEEALWKDWNIWLKYQGFQPTAFIIGDHYYKYALSQALLRQSDKKNLWKFYYQHRYPDEIYKDDLIQRLIRDSNFGLTHHLKELIGNDGKIGSQRYDDLSDDIYEIFDAWIASGKQAERTKAFHGITEGSLTAGLCRIEDFISRQPQYFILPKLPRHIQISNLNVNYKNECEFLETERPGWFESLPWPLDISEIENGLVLTLDGDKSFHNLVLPKRNFWILSSDPDDITSGIFASWNDRPELGLPFVLLIKKDFELDLTFFKEEGLINWTNTPKQIGNWNEYSDIVVVSDAWGNVLAGNRSLFGQLRPKGSIGISLRGGLRDPHSSSWLVDNGPEVVITSFYNDIMLEIFRTGEEKPVDCLEVKPGEPKNYDWNVPGNYLLKVKSGDDIRERQVTILDWRDIEMPKAGRHKPLQIGSVVVYGALIEEF